VSPARALPVAAAFCLAASCGARTGLLVPDVVDAAVADGSLLPMSLPDVALEALPDVFQADVASEDAGVEEAPDEDGPPETTPDVAEEDALPPIDVALPVDVTSQCPDGGPQLIYLITEGRQLVSFYPPTSTLTTLGPLRCGEGTEAFSMAVDVNGTAYAVYQNTNFFVIDTATLACTPAPHSPGGTFGMAFSNNVELPGESLFVADALGSGDSRLNTIDLATFTKVPIGTFDPPISSPELTGTGAGDLFGFTQSASGASIVQIDKKTARVLGQSPLPGVTQGDAWAFAFWGGDFYLFTDPNSDSRSIVQRYRPSDGSVVEVASAKFAIVGAGVSTCVPQ
jgi:hypothetical protein